MWPAAAQGGRVDPRVTDCLRSRRQLLESSVPRVDEPAATGSSYSDVVLVQEIIALCEHAV